MPRTTKLIMRCLGTSMSLLWATSCAVAQTGIGDEPSPQVNPGGADDHGGSDSGDNSDDFRYYFSVTTDPWERNHGRHWADQLQFDTSIMSKDFVIFYQHLTGNYPMPGPHLSTDPAYMRAHLEELALDVASRIPDPEFSGIAILDYEKFRANWDRVWNHESDAGPEAIDEDFKDDWTDHIRASHPGFDSMSESDQEQLLRETWEAAVRDLYLNSINKAREIRPNAKWGFYGYPYRFFEHRREAPNDVVSYGGAYYNGSELNDRLQWMWDAVDIVTPSVYPLRVVGEPRPDCEDTCTAAEDLAYVENMVREAKRVANGKPVMPFITTIYARRSGCDYREPVNDDNLWGQIMGPALAGADGAILWGHVHDVSERDQWQQSLDQRVMPLMAEGVAKRGGGRNEASDAGDDDDGDESSDNQQFNSRLDSRGGAVSKAADRPSTAGATRVSSRKSTRVPTIKFNPRTDRLSKHIFSLEAILAAKRRAELKRLAAADD